MRKLVSGISIPTTVKKPIERYALGTDSSPDIRSPSAKHTLSKHSNNYPSIRVPKCLTRFEAMTNEENMGLRTDLTQTLPNHIAHEVLSDSCIIFQIL
jgi:hypothetical protein